MKAAHRTEFANSPDLLEFQPDRSVKSDATEYEIFRLIDVEGNNNPGVITNADALRSPAHEIRGFAVSLDARFALVDLRDAPIGMGFSWGRYGPKTEVRRFGAEPIFAYRRPERISLRSRGLRPLT
jgi:hypothetical protein